MADTLVDGQSIWSKIMYKVRICLFCKDGSDEKAEFDTYDDAMIWLYDWIEKFDTIPESVLFKTVWE